MLEDRDEHDDGSEIDFAAEEPDRRRRCPRTTTVDGATEAEPLVVLRAKSYETATRFAPVAGRMQNAGASRATVGSHGISHVPIEGKQQLVESGIGQQG